MNIESYANKDPLIDKSVYMHHTSCIIGDVTIGSNSSVWPYAVIRGDVEAITIGKNTNIQDGSIIHVTHAGPYTEQGQATTIGDDVTIGHRATLHACTVESTTFIGINSTILDKAIIKTVEEIVAPKAKSKVKSKAIVTDQVVIKKLLKVPKPKQVTLLPNQTLQIKLPEDEKLCKIEFI